METFGEKFTLATLAQARELAFHCLKEINQRITVGINEDQGHKIIQEVCLENGSEKFWHPSKFRIASDTMKSFREVSEGKKKLEEGDLYFLDFGPVFLGHEADLGDTFQLGNLQFKNPAKEIFELLKNQWKKRNLTGQELYHLGFQMAEDRGLIFNKKMLGHRISDFPHAIHYRGNLETCNKTPIAGAWVLEVHLIDEEKNCGYFYEDILIEN
tara:strand:- start:224835 stop:225473 length:639 start_codon:yes stop_codon:yes gene_type:complete